MENISLAGFGKRLVAYIIDAILLSFVLFILLIPFGGIMAFMGMGNHNDEITDSAVAAMAGFSILGLIVVAVIAPVIYETLMISSAKQATLGKMAMKIKVVKEDGQKLELTDAIVRTLVKYISGSFCFLLLLVCAFAKNEQNLHDMAAKTFVVND